MSHVRTTSRFVAIALFFAISIVSLAAARGMNWFGATEVGAESTPPKHAAPLMKRQESMALSVTVSGTAVTNPALASTYPDLLSALNALNSVTSYTTPGTIIFTVSGSETAPVKGFVIGSATLNPLLSSTNTITITGPGTIDAAVGTSAGPSATPDGMLYLNGADYVTIDGLTFNDANSASSTVAMEFGVALFKRTAGDGSNNNTIQNCTFNMQRINNANGSGPMLDGANAIEILNSTAAAATTGLTPTNGGTLATNGTNSNNKFYTNIISGGNIGIGFGGFAASSGVGPSPNPATFLGDIGNDIGGSSAGTGNIIKNFGGGGVTNPAAGVRLNNQWSANVSNNNINNNDGGGVNHAATLRGIYGQAGTSGNVTISNNTISLKGAGTTTAVTGIDNIIGTTAASNTVTITGNIIQNSTYATATTGTFTGILAAASATNQNVNSNQVINNTIGASATASSATFQGIYASSSSTNFTANSNTVSGNVLANQAGTIYSIRSSTSTLNFDGNTISNNTIPNSSGATSSSVYGFYNGSSPATENYTNNNINNLAISGSSTATGHVIYGIYILTASGVKTISGNNINNLAFTSSGAGYASVIGIRDQYASTANIFKNVIHSLNSTGTTPTVVGLMFGNTTFTTANVYNNIIGNLTAPQSTGLNLFGIWCGSVGTTYNVSFNTVFLNATSSASGSASSALYMSSTTPTTVLIDNIFINLSTGTTSWLSTAIRRTSTALTSYGTPSNNNFVYAGAPSPTNAIYYDGTNTDQTLAAFKARVTPRETASISEAVSTTPGGFFQSFTGPSTGTGTTFLHLVNGLATQIESGGITVSGITDDYDGNARAGAPDIGADEFTGTAVDLTGPSISYTTLGNTTSTANRVLSTTITDSSGVPVAGVGLPVVYYRKNSDPYTATQCSHAGGNNYNCSILAASMGGVTAADVVSYYVAAQDNAGNVSVNPSAGASGLSANPPAVTTPPTAPNSYTIVGSISGDKTVGVGGDYATLTAAIAAINNNEITGAVTLTLTDGSYGAGETFPLVINANNGSSATNTVTIKPATGVSPTISAAASPCVINLNGADYVTIDGSNTVGGTTRDLTISNTATSSGSAAVCLMSLGTGAGATNNTIKNTNISAVGSTSIQGYGLHIGGTSLPVFPGSDNDNNTIQNNAINAARGIYAAGTASVSAGGMDNIIIAGNSISYSGSSTSPIGIQVGNALNSGSRTAADSSISQNTISIESTAGTTLVGISLEAGFITSTVSRNNITKVLTSGTGGFGGRGIAIATGVTTSGLTIANNFVSGVNGSNWSSFGNSSSMGIAVGVNGATSTITTTTGGVNLYYNSVSMTGSMGSGSTTALTAAIYVGSGASALDLRNNIFSNTQAGTATGQKNYAIYSAAANTAFTQINFNDYFVNNSFNAPSALLGFLSSDRALLSNWQTATGKDGSSKSGNPQFMSTTDLHINPSITTVVSNAGTPVAIANDFDNDARDVSTPDIGADEGNFTTPVTNDMQATAFINPTNGGSKGAGVSFSPQASFTNNGTATQTNVTVRYRICTDSSCTTELYNDTESISSIATGVTTPITFSLAASIGSAGTYTIKATAELGGDQIPTNDEITGSLNIIAPLSGTYSVGSGGNFASLTNNGGVFEALNAAGATGNVVIDVTSDLTGETGVVALNEIAGGFTVLIKPTALRSISGSAAGGLITLNGADGVTIDGSTSGGTDRSLTITNSGAGAVVYIQSASASNGANGNAVKNLNIAGGGNATTQIGIGIGGAAMFSTSLTNNDNNVIQNNNITSVDSAIVTSGVSAAAKSSGTDILDNVMTATGSTSKVFAGITSSFENNIEVLRNRIDGVSFAGTGDVWAISLGFPAGILNSSTTGSEVTNATVSRNYIGTVSQSNTYSAFGIAIASAGSGTTRIDNNMISGVIANGTSGDLSAGLFIGGGAATTNIYYNSVSMSGTLTGGDEYSYALAVNGSNPAVTLRNNIFYNTQSTGSGNRYAVGLGYSSFSNLDSNYNDLFVTSGTGFFVARTVSLDNTGAGGTNHLDLAAWNTATGDDPAATSLSVNPLFLSSTDLHLQETSPLREKGVVVPTVTYDFDGNQRSDLLAQLGDGSTDIGGDEFLPPSAGEATLSGRVLTADGAGIRNAVVTIQGGDLAQPKVARTGAFGYYRFEELSVGETYVLTINSKRYTFAVPNRLITLTDSIDGIDFVALPLE